MSAHNATKEQAMKLPALNDDELQAFLREGSR